MNDTAHRAFASMRAFLLQAHMKPDECKIIIELPNRPARDDLMMRLRYSNPDAESARTWFGIPFEFTVRE